MTIMRVASVLALALAVAASAESADVARFKGTTVTFRVEAAAVTGFTLTANALCLVAGRGGYEIRVIPLEGAAKLDGDGRFTLAVDQKGTRASVTGRVAAAAAEGTFEVYFTKSVSSFDPITRSQKFDIASCSAKSPWTATRQAP
jgi:hypothetical protein